MGLVKWGFMIETMDFGEYIIKMAEIIRFIWGFMI